MKTRGLFVVVLTALMTLLKVSAATYSIEPSADARIIGIPGYQNNNYVVDFLSCYTESSALNTQRTLIQFNLSSIALAPSQIRVDAVLRRAHSVLSGGVSTCSGSAPVRSLRSAAHTLSCSSASSAISAHWPGKMARFVANITILASKLASACSPWRDHCWVVPTGVGSV